MKGQLAQYDFLKHVTVVLCIKETCFLDLLMLVYIERSQTQMCRLGKKKKLMNFLRGPNTETKHSYIK